MEHFGGSLHALALHVGALFQTFQHLLDTALLRVQDTALLHGADTALLHNQDTALLR